MAGSLPPHGFVELETKGRWKPAQRVVRELPDEQTREGPGASYEDGVGPYPPGSGQEDQGSSEAYDMDAGPRVDLRGERYGAPGEPEGSSRVGAARDPQLFSGLWLGVILLGVIVAFSMFYFNLDEPRLAAGTYQGSYIEAGEPVIVTFYIRDEGTFDYTLQEGANETYNTTQDRQFIGRYTKLSSQKYRFILERDPNSGEQEELTGTYDLKDKVLDFGLVDGFELVIERKGPVEPAFVD